VGGSFEHVQNTNTKHNHTTSSLHLGRGNTAMTQRGKRVQGPRKRVPPVHHHTRAKRLEGAGNQRSSEKPRYQAVERNVHEETDRGENGGG